jgi:hypothetical protein
MNGFILADMLLRNLISIETQVPAFIFQLKDYHIDTYSWQYEVRARRN